MEAYQSWQDLLSEDEEDIAPPPALGDEASRSDAAAPIGDIAALSPEIAALMKEREGLEKRLKVLTGQEAPAEDERTKRCFPVFAHTKETRIEERRLRRHDEQRQMANARARERALAAEKALADRQGEQETQKRDAARKREAEQRLQEDREEQRAEAEARAGAEAARYAEWEAQRKELALAEVKTVKERRAWQNARDDQNRKAASKKQGEAQDAKQREARVAETRLDATRERALEKRRAARKDGRAARG